MDEYGRPYPLMLKGPKLKNLCGVSQVVGQGQDYPVPSLCTEC